jgi:hypothetical protein
MRDVVSWWNSLPEKPMKMRTVLDETVTYDKATVISYMEVGNSEGVVEHFGFEPINIAPGDSVRYTATVWEP